MNFIKNISSISSVLIIGIFLLFQGCVEFKAVTLYDGIQAEPILTKPKSISQIVEPIIFDEDATDVWGIEKADCTTGTISKDITHDGKIALHFIWDRNSPGCIWAGFGIGWDGYAGKDLSGIMDFAAIEFYVRTEKGKMFGLPIVLTLEDYSGGMGFSYTGNKYFERSAIDEEWQKVVVPLNTFDIDIENLDPTNIKSLNFEFQQSGSIYLDDIQLSFYEPEPQIPWLVEAPLEDPLATPKLLFGDSFINDNGWGMMSDACQSFQITESEKFEGSKSIHAKWDDSGADNCHNMAFGLSWAKWYSVDLTKATGELAVRFEIKNMTSPSGQLPVSVGFEDYDRNVSMEALTSGYCSGGMYNENWNQVTVPFSDLKGPGNTSKLKYLGFWFDLSGEVYIDNVQLINLNAN